MENLVPLGTGNSRFMKSNIPAGTTLAQLIQMWNNGTFPYDIGPLNSAGISQQGTPLNKDTLLKDATAALYGLGADAVPDEVFSAIYGILSDPLIQEVSYTGTGGYGSGSPSSVTFSFAPDVVIAMGFERDGGYFQRFGTDINGIWITYTKFMSTDAYLVSYNAFSDGASGSDGTVYAKKSENGKMLSWYNIGGAAQQLNYSGDVWHFIGIKFPEL